MEESTTQTVVIEQQKKLTMTGIVSVDSFSPQQIILSLSGGRAVVVGSELKILNFSKNDGNFSAAGKVSGIRFTEKHAKITKRLFG